VLKQISPVVVPVAPNASPRKTLPSSNAKIAVMFNASFYPPRRLPATSAARSAIQKKRPPFAREALE
jgi:hypothetical protein